MNVIIIMVLGPKWASLGGNIDLTHLRYLAENQNAVRLEFWGIFGRFGCTL